MPRKPTGIERQQSILLVLTNVHQVNMVLSLILKENHHVHLFRFRYESIFIVCFGEIPSWLEISEEEQDSQFGSRFLIYFLMDNLFWSLDNSSLSPAKIC